MQRANRLRITQRAVFFSGLHAARIGGGEEGGVLVSLSHRLRERISSLAPRQPITEHSHSAVFRI
jgi:hypothetical protein